MPTKEPKKPHYSNLWCLIYKHADGVWAAQWSTGPSKWVEPVDNPTFYPNPSAAQEAAAKHIKGRYNQVLKPSKVLIVKTRRQACLRKMRSMPIPEVSSESVTQAPGRPALYGGSRRVR